MREVIFFKNDEIFYFKVVIEDVVLNEHIDFRLLLLYVDVLLLIAIDVSLLTVLYFISLNPFDLLLDFLVQRQFLVVQVF